MKKLQKQNHLNGVEENLYFRTHPLTSERITFLKQSVQASPYKPNLAPDDTYLRIKAKLSAFLYEPEQTFLRYPLTNSSIPARYAQAIAFMKKLDFKNAHNIIDALIKAEPNNPYFHEVKAQIYLEQGKISQAKQEYALILKLRPNTALFQLDWAQVVLAGTPNSQEIAEVIKVLNQALIRRSNSQGWLLLSQAYYQAGHLAYADYAAAEYSLRMGEPEVALRQIQNAKRKNTNTGLTLKLEDLKQRIKNLYPKIDEKKFK